MSHAYEYVTLPRLRAGSYFMFASGTTINYCYHAERNLIIYRNMLTGKCRRLYGFVCVVEGVGTLRYVKLLDRMFDTYYDNRSEVLPF